jgi:hypothetical protein
MKYLIYILFFIFTFAIYSEVTENFSKKEALVGEEVEYTLQFKQDEIKELELPAEGFFPEKADMPEAQIISVTKENELVKIKLKYLEAGDKKLSIKWKNTNDEIVDSKSSIQIISSLTKDDKEVLDIVEPLEFSGQYIIRLAIMILVGLTVVAILSYFWLKRNIKPQKVRDGSYYTNAEKVIGAYELMLNELLQEKEISHKEFVYLLSGYVKERLESITEESMLHLTNKELISVWNTKLRMDDFNAHKWESYFSSIKYMPNEEIISESKAKDIVSEWKGFLRV